MESDVLPPYADHVQLWSSELQAWVPPTIFDAHIHLGPAEVMAPFGPQRRQLPGGKRHDFLRDWPERSG